MRAVLLLVLKLMSSKDDLISYFVFDSQTTVSHIQAQQQGSQQMGSQAGSSNCVPTYAKAET